MSIQVVLPMVYDRNGVDDVVYGVLKHSIDSNVLSLEEAEAGVQAAIEKLKRDLK